MPYPMLTPGIHPSRVHVLLVMVVAVELAVTLVRHQISYHAFLVEHHDRCLIVNVIDGGKAACRQERSSGWVKRHVVQRREILSQYIDCLADRAIVRGTLLAPLFGIFCNGHQVGAQ